MTLLEKLSPLGTVKGVQNPDGAIMGRRLTTKTAAFVLLAPILLCIGLCSGSGSKPPQNSQAVYTAPVPASVPAPVVTPNPTPSVSISNPFGPSSSPVAENTQVATQVETPATPKSDDIASESFDAKVVGVTDGDTIRVLTDDRKEIKIRLEGIDAPEVAQEHSKQATTFLKSAIGLHKVTVKPTGTDKYGRMLAFIWFEDVNINEKIIKAGWAWHFKEYNSDQNLADAETEARNAKRGLWKDPNPMAPWDYRHLGKAEPTPSVSRPEATSTLDHWLNTNGNTRHNRRCRWYGNTKRGRYCGPDEGSACGICGG